MEKTVVIGGKEVRMRTSARIPFDYRNMFGKDIIREMDALEKGEIDFGMFDRLAWLLAKNAGEDVHAELPPQEAVGAWLEDIEDCMAILDAAPAILELWRGAESGESTPRKK